MAGPNPPPAVNFKKRTPQEIVETAIDDGMTDPAEIAKWAKTRFDVDMTRDEVLKLMPKP